MIRRCAAVAAGLLVAACPAAASETADALSLQGYTGFLNIPDARVPPTARLDALFTNQVENRWRSRYVREESYLFSVGLFPFLEVGGRLTDASGGTRDLSANAKLALPLQRFGLPSVAVGIQDAAGGAAHLRTKYAVASYDLWRFRLAGGYGTGPDRMKGLFGGAEFRAFDWAYLICENDSSATNAGIRLISPAVGGFPVAATFTAKSSLNRSPGKIDLAGGLTVPLGGWKSHRRDDDILSSVGAALEEPAAPLPSAPVERIAERLVRDGFRNVRVGRGLDVLAVEYENVRYDHNELDALGVVAGIVAQEAPADARNIDLVILRKGIAVLKVRAPLAALQAFLRDAGKEEELRSVLQVTPETEEKEVTFSERRNASALTASLQLWPSLRTYVGTEVGVFDYLLSLKPDLYVDTWKGGVINARADIPVFWSDNFRDGGAFAADRNDPRLERLMLFQTVKVLPTVMATLGAGMVVYDTYGTLNEVAWNIGDGSSSFRVKQAYADYRGSRRETYLGSYRYYHAPSDTSIEATAGKFWTQDRGATVEVKRFFGDTAVSLYYKNSVVPDGTRYQVGGIQFALPLTLRRDMKPMPVQLRGTDEWSYAQETKIVSRGEHNYVAFPSGVNPQPGVNVERTFYNRDRLGEAYIASHLERLREAYLLYVRTE